MCLGSRQQQRDEAYFHGVPMPLSSPACILPVSSMLSTPLLSLSLRHELFETDTTIVPTLPLKLL